MKKIPGFTTTADLPPDIQELYELTEPLEGGPVFDMPAHRQSGIDLSQLTVHTAEVLIARKWPYLRRKTIPNTFVEEPTDTTPEQAATKKPVPQKPPKPDEKGGE